MVHNWEEKVKDWPTELERMEKKGTDQVMGVSQLKTGYQLGRHNEK